MANSDSLAAFNAFDFDGSAAWKQYRLNLEIPPGREYTLPRFKAKWYKREIDPDFDLSLIGGASPSKSSTAAQPPQPQPTSSRAQPGSAGQQQDDSKPAPATPSQEPEPAVPNGGAEPSGQAAPSSAGQRMQGARDWLKQRLGPQDALFLLHAALLLFGLGAVQPLSGLLAYRAWRWFLFLSAITQAVKVYLKRGLPRLRPFSLAALRDWGAPLAATSDFQYLLFSLLLQQTRPLALAVVPIWVLALYHFFAYAASHYGGSPLWQRYGARVHSFLSAAQGQALVVNAGAEVGVGFLLLLGLLSPSRSLILTFIYWKNFLPVRYHTPDAASYHRQVWSLINQRAAPLLRAVPLLETPIGFVRRIFERPQ